jgi:hypothetical protein
MALSQWKTTYEFPSRYLCLLHYCGVSSGTMLGYRADLPNVRHAWSKWQAQHIFGTDPICLTSLFRPASVYCEGHVCIHIYMSDCVETVYE